MRSGLYRKGFTILEVMLFLAVSALLMVGLMAGTGVSVARRRYEDSVNSFADVLKRQYDAVMNVRNDRENQLYCREGSVGGNTNALVVTEEPTSDDRGRSGNCLIYGRVIEFNTGGHAMLVSALVGLDKSSSTENDELTILKQAKLTRTAFIQEGFDLEWGASLMGVGVNDLATGFIAIVRSPVTGTIRTIMPMNLAGGLAVVPSQQGAPLPPDGALTTSSGTWINVNTIRNSRSICVASPDLVLGARRRAVTIGANGSSAAAVQIAPLDTPVVINGVEFGRVEC